MGSRSRAARKWIYETGGGGQHDRAMNRLTVYPIP